MPHFDAPINTNDQSLDRVLANPLPVLLLLTPGTPTQTMLGVLNDVAETEAGNLLVVRLNTSENPNAAKRFHANGAPLLITWKAGSEQSRLENPDAGQIRAAAAFALGHGPAPHPVAEMHSSAQDAHPIHVNEETFDVHVLRSAEPVLVDFWAPWCGPCRMIAPSLERLAHEYAGKLRIAKLNVDENPRLAAQYGASSIPLLVLFKGGRPVQKMIGAHPEPNLRMFIQQALR